MKNIGWIASAMMLALPGGAQAQQLQSRECNAANIAVVAEAIAKMRDGQQKKTASDEIGLASEKMAEGKSDDCKEHLLKATLQTK